MRAFPCLTDELPVSIVDSITLIVSSPFDIMRSVAKLLKNGFQLPDLDELMKASRIQKAPFPDSRAYAATWSAL